MISYKDKMMNRKLSDFDKRSKPNPRQISSDKVKHWGKIRSLGFVNGKPFVSGLAATNLSGNAKEQRDED